MSEDIWPHYKEWLIEERGLKRRSATNYASTANTGCGAAADR